MIDRTFHIVHVCVILAMTCTICGAAAIPSLAAYSQDQLAAPPGRVNATHPAPWTTSGPDGGTS